MFSAKSIKTAGSAVALATALLAASTPAFSMTLAPDDVEALARITYAEAAGQPIEGRAAVMQVVLNRALAGGASVVSVIEASHQFEPVMRTTCRCWQGLAPLTEPQRVEFAGLLGAVLAANASHFQNPAVVQARANAGKVSSKLVDFGGMPIVADIGDHRFYGKAVAPAVVEPAETSGMPSMFASIDIGSDD